MTKSSKDSCMICLEDSPIPGTATFNCNCTGIFHNNCLSEWYTTYPSTCPLCRKNVRAPIRQPTQPVRQPVQPVRQPVQQPLLQRAIPEYQVIQISNLRPTLEGRQYSQVINNYKIMGGFMIGGILCLSLYYIVINAN